MPKNYAVYVCFDGGAAYAGLTARERRDYELVKAAVIADGGYSVFDATDSARAARIFTRIDKDPAIVPGPESPFPWVAKRLRR